MRCRKVRYFLSAYCKGELSEKRTGVISAHLEGCPICKSEEVAYREMNFAIGNLAEHKVSEDFNSRLLQRVADERFKETRTKVYMPKKIPVFTFNRVAPIFAAACFIFAFAFTGGINKFLGNETQPTYGLANNLNDDYMRVKPETDRFASQNVPANWAFNKQVARAARIKGLMNQLASQNYFGSLASSSQYQNQIPIFMRNFNYRTQPVLRLYNYPSTVNTTRGVNSDR